MIITLRGDTMNILYVSPFSHGMNIAPILNIAHLIADQGHNVYFYTVKTSFIEFNGVNSQKMAKIPDNVHMKYIHNYFIIPNIAYPFINPVKEYHDLIKIINDKKIDIIHFNFPEHLICLPILKKSNFNVPTILSINGIPGYDWFYGIKIIDIIGKIYSKYIVSKIIKNSDVIIPLSSSLNSTLKSFELDGKIVNISSYGGSYGIDTDLFKPSNDLEKMSIRQKFGLPKNKNIIIYAGRFSKVKRLDLLIKCFKKLLHVRNDVFLLMVGDGPEKETLLRLTHENKLDETNIKFIEFVDHLKLSELYAASNLFILLSLGEGNPGSLMEACASGLPSIVSNVGGNGDIVKNGDNGYVLNEINDNNIVEKMNEAIINQNKMSKNARQIAIDEFSWEIIIDNHLRLYERLVVDK